MADELDAHSVEPVAPPPEPQPEPSPEPEPQAPAPEPQAPEPVQRSIDPSVADVLREEAEFERAARDVERGAPLESQPDLGLEESSLDEEERRARQARARMARLRGDDVADQGAAQAAVAATTAVAGSRRELLPDIEEINSTLRASSDRKRPAEATDSDLPKTKPKYVSKNRGFRRGFLGMIVLGAAALGAYVFGPQITEQIPAAEPYVAQYTGFVEQARTWLSGSVDRGLAWLDQMASENL